MILPHRRLGPLSVSALALGCAPMSDFYTPSDRDPERCRRALTQAYESGINHFDTADMYGFGDNEVMLGETIRGFRDHITIASKFGFVRTRDNPHYFPLCGKPAYLRQQCEGSLKRLGIDCIDLYYLHRVDPETPIEETVQAMSQLVQEGKVRYLGLSEVTPDMLRRAHDVHPIAVLQSEYSLCTRRAEESILATCQELGIGFMAYSPIGRGFFSGHLKRPSDLAPDDFRARLKRFQNTHFDHNLALVASIESLAAEKGCTAVQLALAWILARPEGIVPLFGTTRPEHIVENVKALTVVLSSSDIEHLNALSGQFKV